jgi:hypothetical protein
MDLTSGLVTRPRPVQVATPLPTPAISAGLKANDLQLSVIPEEAALVVFSRRRWWFSATTPKQPGCSFLLHHTDRSVSGGWCHKG